MMYRHSPALGSPAKSLDTQAVLLLPFLGLSTIKESLSSLWRAPAVRLLFFPWAVAFLLLQLVNTQDGGPNAVSRFLTMRSMSELGSFTIDTRTGATSDWSKTPDPEGHYYSNKAPGPMLLGFPTFFVIDQIPRLWEKGFRDEFNQRHVPGYFQKTWTSFLNQIVPLLLLLAFIVRWLNSLGIARSTQIYFLLATFFGSTASMYFNNYSGHGLNAILQLGLLFTLLLGRYRWVGFFAGAALLSDYSFVVQIPAFLVALAVCFQTRRELWRPVGQIAVGAILPAALWTWYHTSAFGSPFLVANHFQNPVFQDTAHEAVNFLGIFRIPQPAVLWELLFGQSRGLLFTQPWLLFLIPVALLSFLPAKKSVPTPAVLPFFRRVTAAFCVLSLAGLLLLNMSYGGWLGGGAAGPRYLSGIFLCFAFWMALELDRFPAVIRYFFWAALLFSLVFRSLVFGSTILGPGLPLWQWYWYSEFARPTWTPQSRLAIFWLVLAGAWFYQRRLWKKAAF